MESAAATACCSPSAPRRDWREDNYWPIFNGSLFDERGKEIFGHWLNGDVGEDGLTLNGQNWSQYMMGNNMLKGQIADRVRQDIEWRNGSGTLNIMFHPEIQNGYFTAYQMLHGPNSRVGDFVMTGTADYKGNSLGKATITYNLAYTWNDIIDPNFQYQGDQFANTFFRTLYTPKNYVVRIHWDASCVVEVCDKEITSARGYPFD